MSDGRQPFILAIPGALLRASFGFAWGGGLFWMGGDLSDVDNGVDGGFGLRTVGLVIIAISVVGFIYLVLKARAPSLGKDRPATPADDLEFDPDAAIENYLRSRPSTGESSSLAEAPSIRPVFGRRAPRPEPDGGDS